MLKTARAFLSAPDAANLSLNRCAIRGANGGRILHAPAPSKRSTTIS